MNIELRNTNKKSLNINLINTDAIINRESNYIHNLDFVSLSAEDFQGPYSIVPEFNEIQLNTTGKVLKGDLIVQKIQINKFQNEYGGISVIIG